MSFEGLRDRRNPSSTVQYSAKGIVKYAHAIGRNSQNRLVFVMVMGVRSLHFLPQAADGLLSAEDTRGKMH